MTAAGGYIEKIWRDDGWEIARDDFNALGNRATNLVR